MKPTPEDYIAVFQDGGRGEAILADLASMFYDQQTFVACPYKHAYNAGKREVILTILRKLSLVHQGEQESDDTTYN